MTNSDNTLNHTPADKKERFILAGVCRGLRDTLSDTTEESMKELEELVKTAGGEAAASVVQNRAELESATYMGEGKLEEIKNAIETLEADSIVFDDELSPVQLRNISDILGIKVLDRSMLILDIFAMRAKTSEGKLQVELAQLKYRLPRLRGFGTEMSRTGAGIGTRGPGETRLESDRRHIRRRIAALEDEIEKLKKRRGLLRSRRKKDGVVTAALVGYTNAGKSTLLNTLTDAGVFAEDKLFATLDPTSRGITLGDNRRILLVDTVGFIRKLPHNLIEAFKSTLEEAAEADILLHVIDASSPVAQEQVEVAEGVLDEIGASGKPTIGILNKCDILPYEPVISGSFDVSVAISAKRRINIDRLIKAIEDTAPGKKRRVTVLLPYSMGAEVSALHADQKILDEEYTPDGTRITLLADSAAYERIREFVVE
ncbi:MAG TPA: GTPase HflX [Candidatus Ornithomonoglobus intestinigallinarum]|uniref:GTPase HflX n=1 Tax=Candidatus Ornithomonoglobus intestinigallinarum TaxID=2840894 RepID=A0A9D1KPX2_9FIRM|nr:GTPase HflX [Candidatus Ornithomonoglobus intestinigallinarum]